MQAVALSLLCLIGSSGTAEAACTPGNKVLDGGFEAATGDPLNSPNWTETSTNFSSPLCSIALCGDGLGTAGPRTGTIWSWFGGAESAETSTLSQSVTFPGAGATSVNLNFFLRVGAVSSPFTDVLKVKVDGVSQVTFPEPALAEGAYSMRTVNLLAFANGAPHTIQFEYTGPESALGANFNVDDVRLDVACSADPTIASIDPTSGPAGTANSVTLTGANYQVGAVLKIGGKNATGVSVPNSNTIKGKTPVLTAGSLNDVSVINPDTTNKTLPKGWFADFTDVPQSSIFHDAVENIVRLSITAGCGTGTKYCPLDPVTRAQMAVFLLKAEHGAGYTPPACTGKFTDVKCSPPKAFAVDWIERLAAEGITAGCGNGSTYCPNQVVTRAEMAVFILKTQEGSAYSPPACSGVFLDVACSPTPAFAVKWIERLYAIGVTGGCGAGPTYCPGASISRQEMAALLTNAFPP